MKPARRKLSVARESIRTLTAAEMVEAGGAGLDTVKMCSSGSQFSSCCPRTYNLACAGHSATC